MISFGSDNHAGAHPAVLEAIGRANVGHMPAYGADPWTDQAVALLRRELGDHVEAFLAFNGTGANVMGLQSLLRPWEHVICTSTAHVNVDETGAPERMLGSKLFDLPTPDGKLTPAIAEAGRFGEHDVHHTQARVVLISQTTELGTLYTPDEIRALADWAHERDLFLYMDGARIGNAAAALGTSLRAITTDAGVDVLSFGGTKNGAISAEAVCVLNPALAGRAADLPFIRKSMTQLMSKMRFSACQFVALLEDGLWRANAEHANAMAQRLAQAVQDIPGVQLTQPVQANGVFAQIPAAAIAPLSDRWHFYTWDATRNEVRWMCAWNTAPEDVDAFAADIRETVSALART